MTIGIPLRQSLMTIEIPLRQSLMMSTGLTALLLITAPFVVAALVP